MHREEEAVTHRVLLGVGLVAVVSTGLGISRLPWLTCALLRLAGSVARPLLGHWGMAVVFAAEGGESGGDTDREPEEEGSSSEPAMLFSSGTVDPKNIRAEPSQETTSRTVLLGDPVLIGSAVVLSSELGASS